MLIFDLLPRQHLDKYLKNSLKQIESCLEKSADSFIKNRSYLEAQNLFASGETTMVRWSERFGNQVKSMAMRMAKMEEERARKEAEARALAEQKAQQARKAESLQNPGADTHGLGSEQISGNGNPNTGESKYGSSYKNQNYGGSRKAYGKNEGYPSEGDKWEKGRGDREEETYVKKRDLKEIKNIGQWGDDVSGVMRKKKTSGVSDGGKWGGQSQGGNGWVDSGKTKRKKGRRKGKGRGHGRNKGTVRKWVETTESVRDREANRHAGEQRDSWGNFVKPKNDNQNQMDPGPGTSKEKAKDQTVNGVGKIGRLDGNEKENGCGGNRGQEKTASLVEADAKLLTELAMLNLWTSEISEGQATQDSSNANEQQRIDKQGETASQNTGKGNDQANANTHSSLKTTDQSQILPPQDKPEPKISKSTNINSSATTSATEQNQHPPIIPNQQQDINNALSPSTERVLSLQRNPLANRLPCQTLARLSRREILHSGRSSEMISNINFGGLKSEPSQARAGPAEGSGGFILENVDRRMNSDICVMISQLGETLRPEMLVPIPEDEPIQLEDYLLDCQVLGEGALFSVVDEASAMRVIQGFLSAKNHSDKTLQELVQLAFEAWSPQGQRDVLKRWIMDASDDHVDLFFRFFQTLLVTNPRLFRFGVGVVTTNCPVRLFSIHLMYRFIKKGFDIDRGHMDKLLGAWFDFCLDPNPGTELGLLKSKKNILVGFLIFAVPNGGCELSNLSLKVDRFCSENSDLKDLLKMKEAIANQRNAKHKRRKKLAPGFT